MTRAFNPRVRSGLLAAVLALATLLGMGWDAVTQAPPPASPLLAADPEPNALLAAFPSQLALTFHEPVDPESAAVQLLRAGGAEVPLDRIQVDAGDFVQLIARSPSIVGTGDFTVVWSARAADDGALLAGAYPFRTGVVQNPGAARLDGEWPAPWATVLRWLVFLGTALAAGGFAWARFLAPRPGGRAPGNPLRMGTVTIGALVALLASALMAVLASVLVPAGDSPPLTEALRAMPLGWWLQIIALLALTLLCLGVLASGSAAAGLPAIVDELGISAGLAALVGLSLTSHAASPLDTAALVLAVAHQWSTAFWVSGLLYLGAGWRDLGTDVARFRTVRWIGGVLLAVSIVTGLAGSWPLFSSLRDLVDSRYGQVLAGKGAAVLVIIALGFLAMIGSRRSNAVRASRSLGTQGLFAVAAVFLAALLALLAAPGTVAPATLAGVALADVVPVDRAAFGAERATIHLLTQPAAPGAQTLVVRLTDGRGAPLMSERTPEVQMDWTFLSEFTAPVESAALRPDPSSAVFTGAVTLPRTGWWQAEVTITPPDGIASRALFWLVLPDPNVTGRGPNPETDAEAQELFQRGLASLTSLPSVRYSQRLADGGGSLYRSRTAVTAAEGERPAAYTETVIDAEEHVIARQTIVGDRRWTLADGEWILAEPIPFLTPAAWGEAYTDATGFQFGPRENIDGELSQVVTFWQPPRERPSRTPAWFAWWVGLASGEVRREAMISTRHYMVYEYRDFDAPFEISPPVETLTPGATPAAEATPVATPTGGNPSLLP